MITTVHWNYTRDEGGILISIIRNYNTVWVFFTFLKKWNSLLGGVSVYYQWNSMAQQILLHNNLKISFYFKSIFLVWRHLGLVFFFIHLSLLQTQYLFREVPKTFLKCKIMLGSQTLSKWNKSLKSAFWNLNKQEMLPSNAFTISLKHHCDVWGGHSLLGHKIFEKQRTQLMLKVHRGIKRGKVWAKSRPPQQVLQKSVASNEQQKAPPAYLSSISQHSKNEENRVFGVSHLARLTCTCRRNPWDQDCNLY